MPRSTELNISVEKTPKRRTALKKAAALALAGTALFSSCAGDYLPDSQVHKVEVTAHNKEKKILEQRGMLGKHDLEPLVLKSSSASYAERSNEDSANMPAQFVQIIDGGQKIRLAWKANDKEGTITVSELPRGTIQVIKVDDSDSPSVSFDLDVTELVRGPFDDAFDPSTYNDYGMSEERLSGDAYFVNPDTLNGFLNAKDALETVDLYLPPQEAAQYFAQISKLD